MSTRMIRRSPRALPHRHAHGRATPVQNQAATTGPADDAHGTTAPRR
jgi:hypothetical protein